MKFYGPEDAVVDEPSPHYADVAGACREMGMDIADDDYERIDALVENSSVWATDANDADSSIDLLVAGYLPHGGPRTKELLTN